MTRLKIIVISLCLPLVFLGGCTIPMNMNSVSKEPNFAGVVADVYDNSILVSVNEGEETQNSSDLIDVSLVENMMQTAADYESNNHSLLLSSWKPLTDLPSDYSKEQAVDNGGTTLIVDGLGRIPSPSNSEYLNLTR